MTTKKGSMPIVLLALLVVTTGCGGGSGSFELGPVNIPPPVELDDPDPGGIWTDGTITIRLDTTVDWPVLGIVGMSTSAGELRFVDERGFSYLGQVETTKTSFGGVITQRFSGTITEFAAPGSQFPDGSAVVKGTIAGSIDDSGRVIDALIDPDDRLSSTVGGFRTIYAFYDDVYERNSSLALVSGTWRDGTGATYSIDGNGAIFGQTSTGCVYDGQVSLIDSNNNLYRVEIDVSSCQDENGSFTGLGALFDGAESGDNERFLFLGNQTDIKALTLDLSRM